MANWDPSTIAMDRRDLERMDALAAAAEARACCLVVYSGGEAGRALPLAEGSNLLGRASQVTVQLDHPGVSRRHAEVVVQAGQAVLHDLGSANGTYCNDQPVGSPVPLHDGDLLRLGSVVLKFYRERGLDAALHDRLYRLAMVDEGTGVFNRRYLLDALQRAVAQARASGATQAPLCVVGVDLDHFKRVNDRFGHPAGDDVLRDCAAAMKAVLGPSAVLARLGGEEFIVLLPGVDAPASRVVAERLRQAVAAVPFALTPLLGGAAVAHRQTASFGIAALVPALRDPAELLALADQRLYEAKEAGRNQVAG
jgi:diguanylate cyclase (GGDEF)-like protein